MLQLLCQYGSRVGIVKACLELEVFILEFGSINFESLSIECLKGVRMYIFILDFPPVPM